MSKFLKKYKKVLYIPTSLLIIIGIYFGINILTGKADDSGDRVHFIRSEEGDAIIVESNGHCGLVDALDPVTYSSVDDPDTCDVSTKSTVPSNNSFGIGNGYTVKNYAEKIGCEYFDFVIMTHSHKDHIGGIPLLKDMFNENTIVFYKEDLKPSDDYEEGANTCYTYDNHEYQQKALETFAQTNSITCDVSKASSLNNPKCNISNLHNKDKNNQDFIKSVTYDANDAFVNSQNGYDTKVKENLYFDFGDYKINLYSLYNISEHIEDLNSIATLITHKNSGAKALLAGDIKAGPFDKDNEALENYSNLIENPTGNCTKCLERGLDSQLADVIGGKVDLLKASDHGRNGSNSLYSLDIYQPEYYITTGGTPRNSNSYSNIVAMTYLKNRYGTTSYYATPDQGSNNAIPGGGAVVAQFNDSQDNKLSLMNYNSMGRQSSNSLVDRSNDTYYNLDNQLIEGKIPLVNKNSTDFVYGFLVEGKSVIGGTAGYQNSSGTYDFRLDENGLVVKGFYTDWFNNKYYYSDAGDTHDGEMLTGLQHISLGDESYLFFFRPDLEAGYPKGSMVTGFRDYDGKTYYFRTTDNDITKGPQGAAVSGLVTIGDYTYYFIEDSESQDVDSELLYSMLKNGSVVIDGNSYHFDANGHLIDTSSNAVTIPTSVNCNNVTYNGDEQVLANDGEGYTVTNVTATNAGTYPVTAIVNPGYVWQDKTTTNKVFNCKIEKAEVYIEEENKLDNVDVGFTGSILSLTPEYAGTFELTKESNKVNFTVTSKHVNDGETFNVNLTANKVGTENIQITFTPDSSNYVEYEFDPISLKVNGIGTSTQIPTSDDYCNQDLIYNGEEQILTKNPATGYTFVNNKGTNAKKYTVRAKLESGYKWADGTIDDKTIVCRIKKATPTITKTNDSVKEIIVGNTSSVMTVSSDVGGTFTYIPDGYAQIQNDTDQVDPGMSRNIEVTGLMNGTSTVTVVFTPTDSINYDVIEFTINGIKIVSSSIPVPTSETYCNKNLVYNGTSQTLATAPYSSVTLSDNTATNAGSHTVTASLNDNSITWGDGTITNKTFDCNISKVTPTINKTNVQSEVSKGYSGSIATLSTNIAGRYVFDYTGDNLELSLPFIDATANQNIDLNINAVKNGSSSIKVTFIPTDITNYNEVIEEINVSVTTTTVPATIPTSDSYCKENLVYNGSEQTLTKNPGAGYTFTNNVGTNADSYTVTASLNSGYVWSDETTTDKTINCLISKADPTISVTEINTSNILQHSNSEILSFTPNVSGEFTFTAGNTVITNYQANQSVGGGETYIFSAEGLNVGTTNLIVTFTPENQNYNSYNNSYTITVVENSEHVVSIPTQDSVCLNNIVYTGSEQVLTVDDNDAYEFINNKATNAGNYNVTVKLKGDYKWSDNTTTDKTVTCNIAKADLNVPEINGYIGTYDGNPHYPNLTTIPDAVVMYSSDNDTWSPVQIGRTDAGTSTVYVKYVGDSNHKDSNAVSVKIIINKAKPVISTVNLNPLVHVNNDTEVGPISSNVGGIFTITSANTSILTVPITPMNVTADEQIKFNIRGVADGSTTYTITFTPGSENYDPVSIDTDVDVNQPLMPPATKPTAQTHCVADLKYTGSPLTITKEAGYGYTFTNNVQTDVGSYTVTAKLNNGVMWSDNTSSDVTFNCSIIQADSYLNFNSKLVEGNGFIKLNKTSPTTYTELKSLIDTNGVISHNKTDAAAVATCDVLSINLGGVIKHYSLVVPGDITKTGSSTVDDVNLLFNYLRNKSTLSECQLKASDTTNDDSIFINDVAKLYQFVNHKIEGLGE